MARLRYRSPSDLPESVRELAMPSNPFIDRDRGSDGKRAVQCRSPRNTHQILAHNPEMLEAHRRIGSRFAADTGLTPRRRELAILGVARALDSQYIWHQHVPVALNADVDLDEIRWIAEREYTRFDAAENVLLDYVTAIVDRSVDDYLHGQLETHFDEGTIAGILLLVGYYVGLDYWAFAINLDLEEPFVGWNLDRLNDQ